MTTQNQTEAKENLKLPCKSSFIESKKRALSNKEILQDAKKNLARAKIEAKENYNRYVGKRPIQLCYRN
jgi:hypothetical protein